MASPTDIILDNAIVNEFAADDTVVGILTGFDADVGDTLSFAFKDVAGTLQDAGGRFKIVLNGISGEYELQVADYSLLDFEDDSTWDVTIVVTDAALNTYEETLTITLADVDPENVTGTSGDDSFEGGAGNDTLIGSGGADTLTGNGGADSLNGGAGVDTMIGGAGDDIYVVDDASDVTTEGSGAGTDTVQSSVDITLDNFIENLLLTGAAINGTGNNLDNVITGNANANLLSGTGGADTMTGLAGDDTYVVDNASDVVDETAVGSAGTDTVQSSVDYSLGTNVENLVLTLNGSVDATGNAGNNTITGNSGSNLIDGGAGADTMRGETGNDTYVVDNASDSVAEDLNEGSDEVQTSLSSFTLGDNFEKLVSTGGSNFAGTGNALNNTLTGGAGDDTLDGGAGNDSMAGGLGDDVYIVDSTSDVVTEAAVEGTDEIRSSVTRTLGADIEDLTLTGAGNVNGTGNVLENEITGNSGDNRIDGGDGFDHYFASAGDDTYVFKAGDDDHFHTAEDADALVGGVDTIETDGSLDISVLGFLGIDFNGIENITLTGTSDINATGNGNDNTLTGNSGANLLSGGTGADTMSGGNGNDTFIVDDANDAVLEAAGVSGGTDEVRSAVAFTISSLFENLTLTGLGNVDGTGNFNNNVLTGNAGDNRLNGMTGADTMEGGAGNDTFVVDNAGDVVTDSAGSDAVETSVSFTIASGIESLTLTGGSNINGTGSVGDNTLTGNTGGNVLDGAAGADTMLGGAGGDTYVVDDADDVVTENASEGTDRVRLDIAAGSYTLTGNVEELELLGTSAGGTGNALNNRLIGNASDNTLDGGAGNDTMLGGDGDDTYTVDGSQDVITEVAGEGSDTVNASATYTLAAELEDLVLTGSGNINGTGNAGGNSLIGNSGNNVLDGGAGADTMTGGDGNDTYVVDSLSDVIDETGLADTTDTARATISFSLATTTNVENLALSGTADIDGTGDSGDNRITGNSGANRIDGGTGADTMAAGDGDDTYVVDDAGDVVNDASGILAGVDTVEASISFTLGTYTEHLTLTGTAAIDGTGNVYNNRLTGNSGANVLDGAGGNDTMIGGDGNDTYVVNTTSDVITEVSGEGTDTVNTTATQYTLGANVENLVLTGASSTKGTGNGLANQITGNGLANVLGGGAGADTLTGGLGNDTYVVDNIADSVVEAAGVGTGTDLVQFFVTRSADLYDNVETLQLMGTAAIDGYGNALANRLTGNSGNNLLDGKAGADTMVGGNGNDTYIVDNVSDRTWDTTGVLSGTDVVRASVSFSISGQQIETLELVAGAGDIEGIGNGLANTLTGNEGANRLNGGQGVDTMVGGNGNDTYLVDNAGDVVTEASGVGTGTDLVSSSVSYTLGSNLENLTLSGAANINGTGNADDNVLTGNAGKNQLDGQAGDDTMAGGSGDDTYVIDSAADVVTEAAGGGNDTIQSSATWTLALDTENLVLTGGSAINGNGNAGNNSITSNGQSNVIMGLAGNDTLNGGLGADTLNGGAGLDFFVFDSALGGGNIDRIGDFTVADDTIRLENAVFTALSTLGTLGASAFSSSVAAMTADSRIVIDGAGIYYDEDGTGATAAVQFATLSGAALGATLTNTDFVVI